MKRLTRRRPRRGLPHRGRDLGREDPYYGVRVVVLSALEAWDTAQARRLIQELTNDEHPQVRDEALRFL